MDGIAVLKYGHLTLMKAIENFPQTHMDVEGACGRWSVQDIIAHLLSYEHLLSDILTTTVDPSASTPTLDDMMQDYTGFNDNQVEFYHDHSTGALITMYTEQCARSIDLYQQIPTSLALRKGVLPWYGEEYDLEDFIVYTFYGHKREHSAQINAFRDVLDRRADAPTR